MVVGGEVVTLKSIEESSSLAIAEMPIHVSFVYLHNFFFLSKFCQSNVQLFTALLALAKKET